MVVASELGAPVLRVFADTQMRNMTWQDVAKGFTQDQVREWMADDLRECGQHGKDHGVIIRTTVTSCAPATTSSNS